MRGPVRSLGYCGADFLLDEDVVDQAVDHV